MERTSSAHRRTSLREAGSCTFRGRGFAYYWALRQLGEKSTPPDLRLGKASEYISLLSVESGERVLVCCRESDENYADHIKQQKAVLCKAVATQGGVVAGNQCHIGTGTQTVWIGKAASLARKLGVTKLVFESTDRILRPDNYHKTRQYAQPRRFELDEIARVTEGLQLMTRVDPDASHNVVRSFQTKRGQSKSRAAKGGRKRISQPGDTTRERVKLLPNVLYFHRRGLSLRQIEDITGKGKSTIQRWLARYK